MKTIDEIRYGNLERLVIDAAKPSADVGIGLSRLVAMATANGKKLSRPMLYQILTKKETAAGTIRNVGDELARKIEDALRLESGWMDNSPEKIVSARQGGIRADILSELVVLLDKMSGDMQEMLLGSARDLLSAAGDGLADAPRNETK